MPKRRRPSSKLSTISTKASRACFENSLIVEQILKHTGHPVENLQLRLVNKLFDSECRRRIRSVHKSVDIRRHREVTLASTVPGSPDTFVITVNNYVIELNHLRKYFEFLVNVFGVKVYELRMKEVWFIKKDTYHTEYHRLIHDAVMQVLLKKRTLRKFTGMQELCTGGCADCVQIALGGGCREYGPLQLDALTGAAKSQKKHHFETLIVYESLVWFLAFLCVKRTSSRTECLRKMSSYITPNITCDHLHLELNQTHHANAKYYGKFNVILDQALPREVIAQMCRVWRVKTVRLEMCRHPRHVVRGPRHPYMCSSEWTWKPFFSAIRFHDSTFAAAEASREFQVDNVTIDFEAHRYVGDDDPLVGGEYFDNAYLIANTRRLLPTSHVIVNKYFEADRVYTGANFGHAEELSRKHVKRLIDAVWKGYDGRRDDRFQVTVRQLLKLTPRSLRFEFPKTLKHAGKVFSFSVSPSIGTHFYSRRNITTVPFHTDRCVEHRSRVIYIRDTSSEWTLQLEVFVEKRVLDAVSTRRKKTGMLKYF